MATTSTSPLFGPFTNRDLTWLGYQWYLSQGVGAVPSGLPRSWGERSLDGLDQAMWQTSFDDPSKLNSAAGFLIPKGTDAHVDLRYGSGSTGSLFRRMFGQSNFSSDIGGVKLNFSDGSFYYDDAYKIDYSVRGTIIHDARARIISNLICDDRGVAALELLDDPYAREWTQEGTAPGRRVSQNNNTHHETILTGNNPLPTSGYHMLFGQYNDHGFDFLDKGKDGAVAILLMADDELYQPGSKTNFMMLSRGNTIRLEIGTGSSDALVTALGLKEGLLDNNVDGDNNSRTWDVDLDNSYTSEPKAPIPAGNLVLNEQIIAIAAGSLLADIVSQINQKAAWTGVVASADNGKLKLTPRSGESINNTSAPADLNQTYGSNESMAVFLKEYDEDGKPTGRILEGQGGGIARWSDLKANALRIGLILHDRDVTQVPLLEKIPPGENHAGQYGFVVLGKTSGNKGYVFDTADANIFSSTNPNGQWVLANSSQAFLMDLAHGWNAAGFEANGDLKKADPNKPTLLDLHAVGGDGRLNENLGLTSLHDIFVKTHNSIFEQIDREAGTSMSIEEKFESARLVTLNFYQHHVFQEYVRRNTPNVGAFAGSRTDFSPSICAEFAGAVFRYGHSQAQTMMAMTEVNANGIINSTGKKDIPLLQGFLAPYLYGKDTAQQIAAGMTKQVAAAVDEFVNPTLRNSLVGLALDLACLNVGRSQDAGLISLNTARQEIQRWIVQNTDPANASAGGLDAALRALQPTVRPYVSWKDFGDHLLHPASLKGFIAAYASDEVLVRYGRFPAMHSRHFRSDKARLAYWKRLQTSTDPRVCRAYQRALERAVRCALKDPRFIGKSFNPNGATSAWNRSDDGKTTLWNPAFQSTSGNQKFQEIPLWLGGLAEAKAKGSLLGPTHDFIYAYQMQGLQRGDESYYLSHLGRTDLLAEIQGKVLVDMVMAATGIRHMYHKLFAVNDADYELSNAGWSSYDSLVALRQATKVANDCNGQAQTLGMAGFVGGEFHGNGGNYLDARGVVNPNGSGNASEMFGGTDGNDTIHGGGGDDAIWGDGGEDWLYGEAGNDFVDAGTGNDHVFGGLGSDLLRGDAGADEMWGSGGGDGSDLEDLGTDDLYGGAGNDSLHGGGGADDLNGLGDDDQLWGDGGNDAVKGQSGNDSLHGGNGNDVLTGGEGEDWFFFDTPPNGTTNNDTITDFEVGKDTLVFDDSVYTGLSLGGLTSAQFLSATSDTPNTATAITRFIYNKTNGKLFFDADGNGTVSQAVQVATLAKFNPLLPADNSSTDAIFPALAYTDIVVM